MNALSFPALKAKTSLGRTAIYQLIRQNKFPKPIKAGRRSAWLESEVDAWLTGRVAERDAKAAGCAAIAPKGGANG